MLTRQPRVDSDYCVAVKTNVVVIGNPSKCVAEMTSAGEFDIVSELIYIFWHHFHRFLIWKTASDLLEVGGANVDTEGDVEFCPVRDTESRDNLISSDWSPCSTDIYLS